MAKNTINASEVQKYVDEISYPAYKDKIIENAKNEKAPQSVIETLERIPDQDYNSFAHLSHEISKLDSESEDEEG